MLFYVPLFKKSLQAIYYLATSGAGYAIIQLSRKLQSFLYCGYFNLLLVIFQKNIIWKKAMIYYQEL